MDLELLLEAERRGILPDDKAALLAEARKRGLVDAPGGVSTNSEAVSELGDKLKSVAAGAVNAATLGFADEATGVVRGAIEAPGEGTFAEGYTSARDAVRNENERLRNEEGGAYLGGQVLGGVGAALVPGAQIGTLSRGAGIVPRTASSAAAGGAIGGAYGFGEGEGRDDRISGAMTGAGVGGAIGALTPLAGGAVQKALDNRAVRGALRSAAKNAPTSEQLRAAGQSLYRQVDDAGVSISPQSFSKARNEILEHLRGQGLDELPGPGSLTPKSARVMQIADEMDGALTADPSSSLPFSQLDQLRRHAGTAARSVDATDAQVGSSAIGQIDDFVNTLGPDDLVSGDVKTLQEALPKARDVWARMSRSQIVDDAIEGSEDYLSGGASGIRNGFRRILRNKNLSRGFSDAEKAAMRRVINGTVPEQVLNLLGGGMGQLSQIGLGAATGGIPGGIAGMVGAALSRKGSEAAAKRSAEQVRAVIANGGLEQLPVAAEGTRRAIEEMLRRQSVLPQ